MKEMFEQLVNSVLPGSLFKELIQDDTYIIIYSHNKPILEGVLNRPFVIDNNNMLIAKSGYQFYTKDTIIDGLDKHMITYFAKVIIFDDSQIFISNNGLIVDKMEVYEKQHIKELPYLTDTKFVENIKKIHWINYTLPELFKDKKETSNDLIDISSFRPNYIKTGTTSNTNVMAQFDELEYSPNDIRENPEIIKGKNLSDDQQLKVIVWNPNTIFHMEKPCELAIIALIRKDMIILKQYLDCCVGNVTDKVKREIAKHDFQYLLDRYCVLPEDLIFKAMRKNVKNVGCLDVPKNIAMELVKENPRAALHILDADEEVKVEALKRQPQLIKEFKNFTVDMLLTASGEKPYLFKQCKDAQPEIAKKLLAIRGDFIQYFDDKYQSEELCLIAVKSDPTAIKYIAKENLTEQICQTAVQLDPNVFKDINNPSEAVYILVVSSLPGLLKDIKKQTLAICQAAVNKTPAAIQFVDNQTEELCLKAINKDATTIKHIKNPTPEMICKSIQQDPLLIGTIDTKILDLDICVSCAYLDPNSIDHITDKDLQFDCLISFTEFITIV